MTTAFSFSGGAPQAQPAALASSDMAGLQGGQAAAAPAFGQAQRDFTTGMSTPSANGSAMASTAASNPFSAPPVNPFLAKATPAAPAFGSAFPSATTTTTQPAAAAPAPANPFQSALKTNAPSVFASALSQPAATTFSSTFGAFGRPTQAEAPVAQQPAPTAPLQPQQPSPTSLFQTTQPAARGSSPNPFSPSLVQPSPTSSSPFESTPAQGAASTGLSGFQSSPATTGFDQPAAFGASTQPTSTAPSGFAAANPFLSSAKPAFTPSPSTFGAAPAAAPTAVFGALSGAAPKPPAKKSVHFDLDPVSPQPVPQGFAMLAPTNGISKPKSTINTVTSRFSSQPPASSPKEPQSDYARKIVAQLQKDRLKPPQWPTDPGNPANASAMEAFWIAYGNYRDKVRTSLVKAGLIDDPKVRKRLDEAIDFKGICEEMCPEYEKIERIFQHNVMMAEKAESPDGTMWPSTPLMVKALTRSSAGQEAPLPMDVRTVAALKRTLDHLIDDVLGDDSRLPSVHNFLWDRTRAIRRDFIFHSNMSEEEMLQQIYCLETITRFHATCLHLLSQKGFAPEGFDQRQEREQLSKALLSLLQAYDDCKDRQITCSNECEFRAYFILLNAHDPNFQHKVSEWGIELWYDSDDVQTAMTLAQAMQSVWDWRGPVKPTMPTTTALGAFATFFRIIESPQVSYTMACLAEVHFVHVRRGILRNMTKSYARARDSPKDLTIAALNDMLRFDTIDEAWEFVTTNKLEFSSDDKATAHLVLDKAVQISSMPIPQSFSQNLVERKRAGRSLPEALHSTVYEDSNFSPPRATAPEVKKDSELFVSQSTTSNLAPSENPTKAPTVFPTAPATSILGTAATKLGSPSLFATASSTSVSTHPSFFSPNPLSSTSTPADQSSIFSQGSAGTQKKDATSSLFQSSPSTSEAKDKTSSASLASSSTAFTSPFSTTPTSSPAKPSGSNNPFGLGAPKAAPSIFDSKPPATATAAPAAAIFSQPPTVATATTSVPAASVLSQPAASTSFSSLFPTPPLTAPDSRKRNEQFTPPATAANPLFAASAAKKAEAEKPDLGNTESSSSLGQAATTSATSLVEHAAPSARTASQKPFSASVPQPHKADPMGDFTKWLVSGDNGILSEFKEAFVEHLIKQTFEQFQRDEEERLKREEDEKSWAEALRFKTYNLRVKFFYKWRRIARERALDRRARQARDELKAYRATKRAEQRAAAEKAAADEREKAAEARRMGSKEVKFLEELGYYGDFGASSRKRKASVSGNANERARSVSMSVVEQQRDNEVGGDNEDHAAMEEAIYASGILHGVRDERKTIARVVQEAASPSPRQQQQQQQEQQRNSKLPVRSIKEGISNTVSRAKELLSSRISSNGNANINSNYNKRHRESIGSVDGGSISGDSLRSVRSSFSPDGSQVAYYRRSIPGKSRVHSIFTRVPSGTAPEAAVDSSTPPKKMTNFMRHSKKNNFGFGGGNSSVSGSASGGVDKINRWSSPGITRPRPATATASLSPSSLASFSNSVAGGSGAAGSNVRSSYWRLRAMGMVQMPNKQYLHESLALPMLQDGKRFPGVGNYGLPPVPTWNNNDDAKAKEDDLQMDGTTDTHFDISKDGGVADDDDDDDDNEDAESRAKRYAEERLRRTAAAPSRKRLFSGGGQDGTIGATKDYRQHALAGATTTTAVTSPPDAKKARVSRAALNSNNSGGDTSTLSEAERVIREMREMADAMDQGRDWFKEQTELMKSGTSAWGE